MSPWPEDPVTLVEVPTATILDPLEDALLQWGYAVGIVEGKRIWSVPPTGTAVTRLKVTVTSAFFLLTKFGTRPVESPRSVRDIEVGGAMIEAQTAAGIEYGIMPVYS